jgi:uncharacterized protein (TIGR03083 family)
VHDIGWHYDAARGRIDDLLRPLPESDWERPVPACPGWRVRDVLSHLLGVMEDSVAGRVQGIPTEADTAEQVARHAADPVPQLLDEWAAVAPLVVERITATGMWPAAIDAVSHEQDLRGALGRPGARDHESVAAIVRVLTSGLPFTLELESGSRGSGEPVLRTTTFEAFRMLMGRRSAAQVRSLDWSADPGPVLDRLFVFGPAAADVLE